MELSEKYDTCWINLIDKTKLCFRDFKEVTSNALGVGIIDVDGASHTFPNSSVVHVEQTSEASRANLLDRTKEKKGNQK